MFWENNIGSLEPGKYADLVVWEQDPVDANPDELLEIKVTATMVDGNWVYRA